MLSSATLFTLIVPPLSALALAVSLTAKDLAREYPVFFGYWIFDIVATAWQVSQASLEQQFSVWVITSMIRWVVEFLIVLELVDRILVDHPGAARVGRRIVQSVLALSVLASIWYMKIEWRVHAASPIVGYYWGFEADRVVSGVILVFMVFLCLLLWRYPIHLSRNTKLYCLGLTAYFLWKAVCFSVVNLFGSSVVDTTSVYLNVGISVCQLFWITALGKPGVARSPAFQRTWSAEEQQRLIETLNAFSSHLAKRERF